MTRVVGLVGDLMDRTRLSGAIPGIEIVGDAGEVAGAAIVVVDLARHARALPDVRRLAPHAWVVAYGPHVATDALAAATAGGADRVLPRSRFFQDPAAAIARPPDRSVGGAGAGPDR